MPQRWTCAAHPLTSLRIVSVEELFAATCRGLVHALCAICSAELRDHTDFVRALSWRPAQADTIVSGSWDKTLRVTAA